MVGEDCGKEEQALEEEGRAILEMRQKVRGEKAGCACSSTFLPFCLNADCAHAF